MEYHMLYVKSRKSFEVRRKNFYYFIMRQNKTHMKKHTSLYNPGLRLSRQKFEAIYHP